MVPAAAEGNVFERLPRGWGPEPSLESIRLFFFVFEKRGVLLAHWLRRV